MAILETDALAPLHHVAVGLAALTSVVHLALGVRFLPGGLAASFVLAGIGFVGGIALFLLGYRRRLLYLVGIAFTAIQIVLYVAFNWPDVWSPIGVVDKAIQLTLVAALAVLYGRES